MPKSIRTDNGLPFGVPSRDVIPLMSLWLIAWNIKPILNRPKMPTDNPNVENNQHTSARWSEVYKLNDVTEIETKLDEAAMFQRDFFKVSRWGNRTRKDCFPKLYNNPIKFKNAQFDVNRAYEFLAEAIYPRLISSVGTIRVYNKVFSVGRKYAGQVTFLNFSPKEVAWICLNREKEILKVIPDPRFSKKNLFDLNLCQ